MTGIPPYLAVEALVVISLIVGIAVTVTQVWP